MTAVLEATAGTSSSAEDARGEYCASVPDSAYSRIRTVVVDSEWVPTVHAMIDAGWFDLHRGRLVSRAYLHRLADEIAVSADRLTGRNCMPGLHALGAKLARNQHAMSARTPGEKEHRSRAQAAADDRARHVHNAIKVFEAGGVAVCVEKGHQLTLLERLEEHANGSDRRVARSVWALTLPRQQTVDRTVLDAPKRRPPNRPADRRPVDNRPRTKHAAKTAGKSVFRSPSRDVVSTQTACSQRGCTSSSDCFCSSNREKNIASPAWGQQSGQHYPPSAANSEYDDASRRPAPKRRRAWEPPRELYQLAMALQRALPTQLRGESRVHLCATLKTRWELGWDADSLVADIHTVYRTRGKPLPHYRPRNPAAWLGATLKDINPTTTPPLRRLEAHAHAADTEPCPHGFEGGARINILTAEPWCPNCRHRDRVGRGAMSGKAAGGGFGTKRSAVNVPNRALTRLISSTTASVAS